MTNLFPQQQIQWDHLIKRWQNHKLPHALLLSGTTNADKHNFALRFAKLLLCQQNNFSEHACDNCHACQLFNANTHPDLYQIMPEEKSKVIRIDQIRDLITQLNQTVQQGRYKIIIINPAEALHNAAVNALLKTLEEPTAQTLFLLITESPGLLPATIRSRCQNIIFHETVTSAQQNQTEVYQRLTNDLKSLGEDKADPIQLATQWAKDPIEEIIHSLTLIVINIIRSSSGNKNSQKLFLYLDQLYDLRKNIQINLNQQLLLENLFYTWNKL